jgi:hypothetical protein
VEKTQDIKEKSQFFDTITNDTLSLAKVRFWRRNLSPRGLARFARWPRYWGSKYMSTSSPLLALPASKSGFVNNPRWRF